MASFIFLDIDAAQHALDFAIGNSAPFILSPQLTRPLLFPEISA